MDDPHNPDACPADYKVSVYKIVAKNDPSETTFAQLQAMFLAHTDNAEQVKILRAIGHCDATTKVKALEWAISEQVRLQDFW